MNIPSNPIKPGTAVTGKISWFGGPGDPTDSGHTASGGTTATPGIALYNRSTLGGYWLVTAPNGKRAVVQQTDLGPSPSTGRSIDFTYSSLPHFGYSQGNFPTDAVAKAVYLGRQVPGNYRSLVKGAQPQPQPLGQIPTAGSMTVPTFDRQGFQQANRAYLAGNFLSNTAKANVWGDGGQSGLAPLFAAGKLTTTPPDIQAFQGSKTFKLAQTNLQGIAGSAKLATHPLATTVSGGAKPKIPYLGTTLAPIQTMTKYFGPQASASQQVTVNFAGHPVQVNRALAANVQALGQAIQRSGLAGQIHDIGGFRTSIGASGAPIPYSMHQFGAAIDVNESSQNWHTMSMDPRMVALFKQFGWSWGGSWGGASRDPGHFQFMGGL